MQDKVGSYTIIASITVGKIVIALGEHLKSPSPYGTWLARADSSGYFWGHYFGDKISALADFGKRITNEAELVRQEIPQYEQMQNKADPDRQGQNTPIQNEQTQNTPLQKGQNQSRKTLSTQSHHQRSKPEKER